MFSLHVQLKSFHNELLTQLEQKVELDSRYLSVSAPWPCLLGPCAWAPTLLNACRSFPRPEGFPLPLSSLSAWAPALTSLSIWDRVPLVCPKCNLWVNPLPLMPHVRAQFMPQL